GGGGGRDHRRGPPAPGGGALRRAAADPCRRLPGLRGRDPQAGPADGPHDRLDVQRLAIVGTGLIGASVGLAARATGIDEVRGWDIDPDALTVAAEREAVVPAASLEGAVGDAELAVVAAPVAALPAEVAS